MTINSKLLQRIKREMGDHEVLEKLKNLDKSDLHSLLLELCKISSENAKPNQLISTISDDRFVKPSKVSQKELIRLDLVAYDLLPKKFQVVELSPVTPFGINSVLTKISQNNVISTTRSLEVLADTTTMLSLLCAKERINLLAKNKKSHQKIDIATSHRIVRQQKFDKIKGFTPHFRAFSLCSAGRDVGHEKFETDTMLEHVCFYLNLINNLLKKETYHAKNIVLYISNMQITEKLIEVGEITRKNVIDGIQHNQSEVSCRKNSFFPNEVNSINLEQLTNNAHMFKKYLFPLAKIENSILENKEKMGEIKVVFDLQRYPGIGYYSGLCFKIVAQNKMGENFPLVDGGIVNWTQRLIESKKERALVSGFGSELFCNYFKGGKTNEKGCIVW